MAMIKCPECGKMYSDTAASCPNCGYRKRMVFSQMAMLITGAMSIVLAVLCLNQSITVSRLFNIAGTKDYGGDSWNFDGGILYFFRHFGYLLTENRL